MGQDVGVPEGDPVGRKRPVVLGRAGVVVVHERDGPTWNPSGEARRSRRRVPEPVKLDVSHRALQDSFRGKVEERARAVRGGEPLHELAPGSVLVIVEVGALPGEVDPIFPHAKVPARRRLLDVLLGVLRRVPADEIEPEPAEPDVPAEPPEPSLQGGAQLVVGVVQVRRGVVVIARVFVAAPVELRVVTGDHVPAPVHGLPRVVHLVAVHVVHPLRPDLVRGAVVDDDVAHGHDSSLAKRRVESHEFVLVAVLARIQVPQVPGEVPLG